MNSKELKITGTFKVQIKAFLKALGQDPSLIFNLYHTSNFELLSTLPVLLSR